MRSVSSLFAVAPSFTLRILLNTVPTSPSIDWQLWPQQEVSHTYLEKKNENEIIESKNYSFQSLVSCFVGCSQVGTSGNAYTYTYVLATQEIFQSSSRAAANPWGSLPPLMSMSLPAAFSSRCVYISFSIFQADMGNEFLGLAIVHARQPASHSAAADSGDFGSYSDATRPPATTLLKRHRDDQPGSQDWFFYYQSRNPIKLS